jgi:ribonuclease Z
MKLALALVALVTFAGIVVTAAGPQVGLALFERAASKAVGRDVTPTLADGLHIALCGAGSPMPDPTRAGPCVAVVAGNRLFVIDAGAGSPRNLLRMGLPPGKIDAVFLTHFHSDHIDGLGELMLQRWVGAARTSPLPVHGPPGVERVVDGFNLAYEQDADYRLAHHGAEIAPLQGAGGKAERFDLPAIESGNEIVVFENDELSITAFRVDHEPIKPAVGYRFDYKGRSAVISGDTAPSASLVAAAEGADVLFHEALDPELVGVLNAEGKRKELPIVERITFDILDYHTTPEQAADAATEAGVRFLVLYHLVPPLPAPILYPAFLGDAPDRFDGPIVVGEDGFMISLPAGGDTLETTTLF